MGLTHSPDANWISDNKTERRDTIENRGESKQKMPGDWAEEEMGIELKMKSVKDIKSVGHWQENIRGGETKPWILN